MVYKGFKANGLGMISLRRLAAVVAWSVAIALGVGSAGIAAPARAEGEDVMRLIDFSGTTAPEWFVVNDGVMGGISRSGMISDEDEFGVFSGYLSLENNGGFASVRTRIERDDLSKFEGLVLRVRGDGRRYQLRLRTDARFDGPAYRMEFGTSGDWEEIRLPYANFAPTFRGRPVPGAPPLDPDRVRQLTLMIADKVEGPFRLEVAWIETYPETSEAP